MSSHRHGRNMSANEEKAYDSSKYHRKENGIVDSSTRLSASTSSRIAHEHSSRRRYKSRSRSPYRADRNRSRSPYQADRQRSRSPYRARRKESRSPHGFATDETSSAKRAHDGDHYSTTNASDPRRFKTHYEDELPHVNAARSNSGATHVSKRGRSDEQYTSISGRQQKSRSPFRHNKHPADKQPARHSEMIKGVNGSTSTKIGAGALRADEDNSGDVETIAENGNTQLSDAELIEQRRKRREAIKARHRAQPTLLMQALETTVASGPSTPILQTSNDASTQDSPSSLMDSPRTPDADSTLGSPRPLLVDNEEDMLKKPMVSASAEELGPSAADYDPSMDMQENRRGLLAHDSLPNKLVAQPEAAAVGKDVDMFADEDDMFADATAVSKSNAQVKALDESLLDTWDYPDGHIRVIIGELLDGKYAIKQQIGKGTFATVVRAEEVSTGKAVAIKIACNNDTMHKAGTHEMGFLEILNNGDPEDKRHIIRLLSHFEHKGHLCLVFESLHADLRETLKKHGRNVGLNLIALRSFAYSIFQALLHMQRNEILHADLKPDNILISERMNQLKICDFGTASMLKDAEVTPYLVSRFYRAPEVMLGIPLDYAIDMWSIGCTLYELYTGRILFAGADNNQMLRSIQECRGKIPIRMLKRASLADKHFDEFGNFVSIERDRSTGQLSYRQPNLTKVAPKKDLRSRILDSTPGDDPANTKQVRDFVDLLEKCLQLDPARRIGPLDALRHSFVAQRQANAMPEKRKAVVIPALAPTSIR